MYHTILSLSIKITAKITAKITVPVLMPGKNHVMLSLGRWF